MARIGGRNTAIAWLAGVLCAGVVAGLFYLAAPMGPVMLKYFTDVLGLRRAVSATRSLSGMPPSSGGIAELTSKDCIRIEELP